MNEDEKNLISKLDADVQRLNANSGWRGWLQLGIFIAQVLLIGIIIPWGSWVTSAITSSKSDVRSLNEWREGTLLKEQSAQEVQKLKILSEARMDAERKIAESSSALSAALGKMEAKIETISRQTAENTSETREIKILLQQKQNPKP